jgi:hypothetical protein
MAGKGARNFRGRWPSTNRGLPVEHPLYSIKISIRPKREDSKLFAARPQTKHRKVVESLSGTDRSGTMSKRKIIVVGALLAAAALTRGQFNPSITSLSPNGVLSFSEVTNASGYRVEWSTNLAQSSWRTSAPPGVVGIPAGGFGSPSVTVGVAQAASFYRVVATVTNPPSIRPRGSYYVNFQNPIDVPYAPVIVDGKTYLQMGWSLYTPGVPPTAAGSGRSIPRRFSTGTIAGRAPTASSNEAIFMTTMDGRTSSSSNSNRVATS